MILIAQTYVSYQKGICTHEECVTLCFNSVFLVTVMLTNLKNVKDLSWEFKCMVKKPQTYLQEVASTPVSI